MLENEMSGERVCRRFYEGKHNFFMFLRPEYLKDLAKKYKDLTFLIMFFTRYLHERGNDIENIFRMSFTITGGGVIPFLYATAIYNGKRTYMYFL